MLSIVHVWLYGVPSMAEIVMGRVTTSYPDGRNLSRAAATK